MDLKSKCSQRAAVGTKSDIEVSTILFLVFFFKIGPE